MITTLARGKARAEQLQEIAAQIQAAGLDDLSENQLRRLNLDICERGRCSPENAERFFASKGGEYIAAQRFCLECPVQLQCAARAVWWGEQFGIFGTLTERERRIIRPLLKAKRPQTRRRDPKVSTSLP